MGFTDNDLKRLKDELNSDSPKGNYMLVNMLARLEAAEICTELYAKEFPVSSSVEAWRKAAEK